MCVRARALHPRIITLHFPPSLATWTEKDKFEWRLTLNEAPEKNISKRNAESWLSSGRKRQSGQSFESSNAAHIAASSVWEKSKVRSLRLCVCAQAERRRGKRWLDFRARSDNAREKKRHYASPPQATYVIHMYVYNSSSQTRKRASLVEIRNDSAARKSVEARGTSRRLHFNFLRYAFVVPACSCGYFRISRRE